MLIDSFSRERNVVIQWKRFYVYVRKLIDDESNLLCYSFFYTISMVTNDNTSNEI